jgi:hypothetical protein
LTLHIGRRVPDKPNALLAEHALAYDADVAVPRDLFRRILQMIDGPRRGKWGDVEQPCAAERANRPGRPLTG